jgi:hypothetical protein
MDLGCRSASAPPPARQRSKSPPDRIHKPRKHGPGHRNRRRRSAERRPRFARSAARLSDGCADRRSVPSLYREGKACPPKPQGEGGRRTAYPAPQRIRAAKRWLMLFENRIGEASVASEAHAQKKPRQAWRPPELLRRSADYISVQTLTVFMPVSASVLVL